VKTLILGATGGIGRALARCLAARGHDLVLAARCMADLSAEAAHLRLCYGVDVDWLAVDATDPVAVGVQMAVLRDDLTLRNLMFPVGLAHAQDDCLLCETDTINLIHANLTSIITTISLLLPMLIESGGGNIVGFGSVAAVRGRSANVVYAAAKRGLESYFESLRHRVAASGVRIQLYRLGYVATQMSFGRILSFPVAAPDWIARRVADGLDRDLGLVHLPRFWAAITPLVRAMPWPFYRKVKF
jgi:short-subunit dehydrogenase